MKDAVGPVCPRGCGAGGSLLRSRWGFMAYWVPEQAQREPPGREALLFNRGRREWGEFIGCSWRTVYV